MSDALKRAYDERDAAQANNSILRAENASLNDKLHQTAAALAVALADRNRAKEWQATAERASVFRLRKLQEVIGLYEQQQAWVKKYREQKDLAERVCARTDANLRIARETNAMLQAALNDNAVLVDELRSLVAELTVENARYTRRRWWHWGRK